MAQGVERSLILTADRIAYDAVKRLEDEFVHSELELHL
jgi:hypothetical protein